MQRTSDIWLATTLMTHGHKVVDIDKSNQRYEFIFDEDIPESFVKDYFAGKITVEPKSFFMNNKILKNMVHNNSI